MLPIARGLIALLTATVFTTLGWADSLSDIYQSALQNDPVMRAARASLKANREGKNISRAALLPQIAISGEYSESENNEKQRLGYIGQSDSKEVRYGASLSQALFDMPSWYKFQGGKALSAGAEAQFAADQQNLIMRVSQAYLNALRAHDNKQTRNAEQRAIERRLEQTRERFEVGLVPITDVHEAQAVFDDARVNSLEAQGALTIAFDALEVLTGNSHTVLSGLINRFEATPPSPAGSQDWVELAINQNFQLKVAKLGRDAARSEARAATAARLPKITGTAAYFDSDSDFNSDSDLNSALGSYNSKADGHKFEVSVSMPIWRGGAVDATRRQAKQQSIQYSENFVAAKRNTIQSARSTHQLVVTNAARVKARKQAITSADSALKATQAGYEVGTRTIIDVLTAQRLLYQAQRNYANARYDYILSMMGLKEVAGQLSPEDIFELDAWLDSSIAISRQ